MQDHAAWICRKVISHKKVAVWISGFCKPGCFPEGGKKGEGGGEAGAHPVFVCLSQVGPFGLAIARLTQESGSSLIVVLGADLLAILARLGKHTHPSIKITTSKMLSL